MAEQYATMQVISPDLVDNSEAPIRWKLRTDVIDNLPGILAEHGDAIVPEGYRYVRDDLERIQVVDSESGKFFYQFQYRRLYERESVDV